MCAGRPTSAMPKQRFLRATVFGRSIWWWRVCVMWCGDKWWDVVPAGKCVAIVLQSTWSTPYYKYKVVLHTTKNYSVLHSTTKYESVLQSTTKHNFATHETSSTLGGATCRTQNKLKLWHSCLLAATYELRRATYGMQSTLELRRACLIAATHEVPVQYAEQIMGCETHWNCHIPVLPRTSDTWSAQYIARSNRSHPSTFPNVAPWQEKQSQQSSNINKFFLPLQREITATDKWTPGHDKNTSNVQCADGRTPFRPCCDRDLIISRPQVRRGYFSRFGDAFCMENATWRIPAIYQTFPHVAPATKTYTATSHAAPATKSDAPTSPNVRLPRKVTFQHHQMLLRKVTLRHHQMMRPPRKVTFQHHHMLRLEVWCEWCVMWVMCGVSDVSCEWCEWCVSALNDLKCEWCGWCEWCVMWDVVVTKLRNSEISQLNFV